MTEEQMITVIRTVYLLFVFCTSSYLLYRGFVSRKKCSGSRNRRETGLQMSHKKRLQMFQSLKPVGYAAEKYRRKCILNFRLSTIGIIIASFYTARFVIVLPTADSLFIASNVSGFLILFAAAIAEQTPAKLFKNYFKNTVTPIIAAATDCIYYPGGGKALADLQKAEKQYDKVLIPTALDHRFSLLFGFYSRIKQEDGFVFRNNGKTLSFEEIDVLINAYEGDAEIFKGLLLGIETEKNVSCPVLVAERVRVAVLSDMKNIRLEDPEFSKSFFVYCSDEIEVRKVLTPRFMEKIKNISLYCDNSPVSVLFIGNMLFAAVRIAEDMFESESVFSEIETLHTADSIIGLIELQKQLAESLE